MRRVLVAVAILLAGCSPAAPEAEQGVTIQHKYGSTTIATPPRRIVTVGLVEQDALLALGVVPVATTEWSGGHPGAIGPWATDELGGAAVPQVLEDTGDGPQLDKIAELKPDLILGLYSGLTKEQYGALSRIAPTVAQPKEHIDYGILWQELTRRVGAIVGKAPQAEALVKKVEGRFAQVRQAHPEFAGATGLMATRYDGFFVFGSQDPRNRLLASLGFRLPPDLDKVIGDTWGASISRERLGLLDTGVLVWSVPSIVNDSDILHAESGYKDLKVVSEGREIFIEGGTDYGDSAAFVTVLSLPYLLDRLVPQLAAAVDGNPATKVEPTW